MKTLVRAAALAGACFGAGIDTAHADIIITPFVGKTFAAQHALPTAARVDEQKWLIGASATWLTDKFLGAEVDFGYAPRFFASDRLSLIISPGSNAISFTGNVVLAVPLSVTRDSLRPYFTAGMGVLHAGVDDLISFSTVDRNLLALSLGGGAIGFVNNRTGVRFDLRHLRSTGRGEDPSTLLTVPRLGFWRATIGVAIRY